MLDLIPYPILGIIFLTQDSDPSQDLIPDLDLEISTNQLNVIIVTTWVTLQTIASDVRTEIFLEDNQIKVGEIISVIPNDTQTTKLILDIEITMLLSAELISRSHLCIRIYNRESSIGIDLVVPTFKETSDPIEEVFQMQIDDTIEMDYSLIDSEPLDIYSRQTFYDDDVQDTVYGTNEEFNTLLYRTELR